MPCYTPLKAHRTRIGNSTYGITFHPNSTEAIHPISLPCGSCIGCKKKRARDWAVRCSHESQMYDNNMFITLTYSDEYLPENGSLNHKDFQLFMKRLRKYISKTEERKVKYFMCGEYGEKFKRPHYHLCLFNYKFPDAELAARGRGGDNLYNSEILQNLWKNQGYCNFGDVTFKSAAYVAGYIDKKITGQHSENHYGDKCPEYVACSNGIGKTWFDKYYRDVYPSDEVVIHTDKNTLKIKPPRYYDKLFEKIAPTDMESVKAQREEFAFLHENHPDNQPQRLLDRYKVALLNKKDSTRNLGKNLVDESLDNRFKMDSQKIKFLSNY